MRVRLLAIAGLLLLSGSIHAATYVVPPDDVFIKKADAVVVARALQSYVEESDARGIETVTVFAVEDVLKGTRLRRDGVKVRVPGGMVVGKDGSRHAKVIAGAPRFANGEPVLLFLSGDGDGPYVTTDFALGLFGFATDDLGHKLLVRAESEINGWNHDGSVHRESRRDATRFLEYIRDVAGGRQARANYLTEVGTLTSESRSIVATEARRAEPAVCSSCNVLQYTMPMYAVGFSPCNSGITANDKACVENGPGARWAASNGSDLFPTAVNFNRGNSAVNVTNSGNDAINAAFASWNGGANVNYVLATQTSNTNGITDPADGVNNIVFEKILPYPAFSCLSGGLLGLGGVSFATTSGASTVEGQSFYRTTEVDVSMNQGVGACIPGSFSVSNFNSAVTHEVGHTLGFRHADKTRENSDPCTSASYDCEPSAIMTAFVTSGLNGVLQPWDARAVARLYPQTSLAAPTGISASPIGATTVQIAWVAPSGASGSTVYQVHRSTNNGTFTQVCTATHPTVTCNDTTALANTAYVYKVRVGSTGAFSTIDLATTTTFTNTISIGATVNAVDITETRALIDKLRALTGLGGGTYSAISGGGVTTIQKTHVTEMRTALDQGRASLFTAGCASCTALSYTDSTITVNSTTVKAAHFNELRNGLN